MSSDSVNLFKPTEDLNPSVLGTLQYWDNCFKVEQDNLHNHGDEGEVWFGEQSEERVLRWLEKNIDKTSLLVDLGCGNGHLLASLWERGFKRLSGLDYSVEAVTMAQQIMKYKGIPSSAIELSVCDLTKGLCVPKCKFDVAIDKGTYDAISLSVQSQAGRNEYINNVHDLLASLDKTSSILFITSCNWTQDELVSQFSSKFELSEVVPTPKFQFGGVTGNSVTSLIFKKKF